MSSHHPFLSHLVALLSFYEIGPSTSPAPRYDGPQDWQTDAIERSLASLAGRMHTAEGQISSIQALETPAPTPAPTASNNRNQKSSNMNMTLGHDDFPPIATPSHGILSSQSSTSAPATACESSEYYCPACGHIVGHSSTSGLTFMDGENPNVISLDESPIVIPSGPLTAAAFESGMSAVEELKLLKAQVQDIARVCKAIALGDLSQKITVPVQDSVMVELKDVINTMVDKLSYFAMEVTRVSQEVGSVGILGGQAEVPDVDGTWRELTNVVNVLAANITNQVRAITAVTKAIARGDLSKQIEVEANGEILDLKSTVNGMVLQLRTLAAEVTRVTLEVGSQGKLGGMAEVPGAEGVWRELTYNVNQMCSNLTNQVRSTAVVTTTVAQGDHIHLDSALPQTQNATPS